MASRGMSETQRLRQQMEEQLDRLMAQLADLEECKGELDPEEYEEVHKDTIEQLNEFHSSLSRMTSGDMTLVDSFNAMQLAEILSALQKLGESLTAAEQTFLDSHASVLMKNFDQITDETGSSQKVLEMARQGLH